MLRWRASSEGLIKEEFLRPNTLLHRVQLPKNLHSSWQELNKSNPLSHGLTDRTLKDFAANLESNISSIRAQLRRGTYVFAPVRGVIIQEHRVEGGIKRRPIRVAEIKDRVVQRAIARVIEPVLNVRYGLRNDASFAYQRKKGIRDAQLRMITEYQAGKGVVFEADLQSFFDTVDRQKLLEDYVFPALPDESLNGLIALALEQEIGNRESIAEQDWGLFVDSGIPQGGALSPLFANVYLSRFDHDFLSKGFGLVRYADDCVPRARTDEAVRTCVTV